MLVGTAGENAHSLHANMLFANFWLLKLLGQMFKFIFHTYAKILLIVE